MERIQISKMPLYKDHSDDDGSIITSRISGYQLSDIVAKLAFEKVNARGQVRPDKAKKAILRALCDRYPMVHPGENDIRKKTGYSVAQIRRVLRELEHIDKLIVDGNSRVRWRKPTAKDIKNGHPAHKLVRECDDAGKKGGRGPNCTPQYFICDRKIYDAYQEQERYEREEKKRKKAQSKTRSSEDENPLIREQNTESKTRSSENETRSYQNETHSSESKTRSSERPNLLNPLTMSDEPIMSCNQSFEPTRLEPTIPNQPAGEPQQGAQGKEQAKLQKQNQKQERSEHPNSYDHDMTVTVACRFEGLEHESEEGVVRVVTDGEFNVGMLGSYDSSVELQQACLQAIRELKNQPFAGRVTCAAIMDRAMNILWANNRTKAPDGWIPVMKKLRLGGPATVEEPKLELPTIEPAEPAEVLTSYLSALGSYRDRLQPFNDLLVEVARYKGVPQFWKDAVPFLDCAIECGDVSHEELIAVRDEIQSRVPQAARA